MHYGNGAFIVYLFERLCELSEEELGDLLAAAQSVGWLLSCRYTRDALTVSLQDGAAAGQSVPHFHLHILPRHPGDFEPNDEVYRHLERTSQAPPSPRTDCPDRPARTHEEMAAEAEDLRVFGQELIKKMKQQQQQQQQDLQQEQQ
ncbi:BIS(5'-nucleosyl)-tetraphosphatase, putative [Eimeria tenella]|uniref:BIS(5'-nucleosyl)-tetraphosphatase, putative n=1 Tax=Eimeria tenella TaxID=5802 RepID=U6KQ89_EIMTE|nr:BIS(5'-nucleosyl)-tetraphosphatase, putative [Eimeria tenella]CDJ40131.1 BIS(5'-nucleosyl)-tetraphosphatase, putative [Eimeria tenella]|eukprot:XP_013230884.1 BIS(5'-nucleosyl)-tetraphosphatase, putative [Eimeria tenella]